jgi:hypothetical protein
MPYTASSRQIGVWSEARSFARGFLSISHAVTLSAACGDSSRWSSRIKYGRRGTKVSPQAFSAHLLTFRGTQVFDPSRFAWPPFLYIPKGANSRDYWPFAAAPDDHRYALEWTSPATATANAAGWDPVQLCPAPQRGCGKRPIL